MGGTLSWGDAWAGSDRTEILLSNRVPDGGVKKQALVRHLPGPCDPHLEPYKVGGLHPPYKKAVTAV